MQPNNQIQIEALEDIQFANPNHQAGRLQEEMVTEISGDRRSRRRYPINLQLMYKVIRRYHVAQTGSGRTLDLSGNGISFETEEPIEPGSTVELSITWPVRLNQTCLLKLNVIGKVARSGPGWAALRMQSYEFRTKGSGTSQTMSAGATLSS